MLKHHLVLNAASELDGVRKVLSLIAKVSVASAIRLSHDGSKFKVKIIAVVHLLKCCQFHFGWKLLDPPH